MVNVALLHAGVQNWSVILLFVGTGRRNEKLGGGEEFASD